MRRPKRKRNKVKSAIQHEEKEIKKTPPSHNIGGDKNKKTRGKKNSKETPTGTDASDLNTEPESKKKKSTKRAPKSKKK